MNTPNGNGPRLTTKEIIAYFAGRDVRGMTDDVAIETINREIASRGKYLKLICALYLMTTGKKSEDLGA